MKKLLCVLLIVIALVGITGCGETKKEPTKVTLTSENFSDYIILNVQFDDAETRTSSGILGTEYKGVAKLNASARLKKDVKVENVVITGKVKTAGMLWSSKEFSFKLEMDKYGNATYSKDVETDYSSFLKPEERPLKGEFYNYELQDGEFYLDNKYILITSLSGSIIEE